MIRALIVCFLSVLVLASCNTQRKICPAYQSAFIFDKPSQKEAFVHFNEDKKMPREVLASNSKTLTLPANDSTWVNSIVLPGPALPKEKRNKKTRYLLLPEKTYKKALRALQTVNMKPVYPKKKTDSLDANIDKLLDSAARSLNDTLTSTDKIAAAKPNEKKDSTYMISLEKEKFNVDQDNYMWYFRNILVLPDVRIAMSEQEVSGKATKASKKEKKGFFGFFKNIFKKKDKKKDAKKDSLAALEPVVVDSTGAVVPPKKEKRKGIFGFLKKKPKVDPAIEKKRLEDAKKEDEEKF
ncbi:MAG: hypothetical protein ACKVOQ_22825 [Cyclobacteriaceae bacterium]